jgi:hypothetical protein
MILSSCRGLNAHSLRQVTDAQPVIALRLRHLRSGDTVPVARVGDGLVLQGNSLQKKR